MKLSREDLLAKLRHWYNGYSWDTENFVYNPYSILSFFMPMHSITSIHAHITEQMLLGINFSSKAKTVDDWVMAVANSSA